MIKKIELSRLINSQEAISYLLNVKLPGDVSYGIYELIEEIDKKIKTFEKTKSKKILDNGGKRIDKDMCQISPGDEGYENCMKEIEQLSQKKVDVKVPDGIKKEHLKSGNPKPIYFAQLSWLFED